MEMRLRTFLFVFCFLLAGGLSNAGATSISLTALVSDRGIDTFLGTVCSTVSSITPLSLKF
jgi:hypothetical protein